MTPLTIKSTRDGITLSLGPVRDRAGHNYAAELQSPVVSGRVEVYDHHASQLAEFFADLAKHWWQGWDGEKTYESLEGHLCLVAARDALGHVSLKVVLRDAIGGADYEVGATLELDSGQLEALAADAKEALGTTGAAEQGHEPDEALS